MVLYGDGNFESMDEKWICPSMTNTRYIVRSLETSSEVEEGWNGKHGHVNLEKDSFIEVPLNI